ncbi:C6 transcription factor [Sarocladium implicatum]|nr:C6 transcription factor [Sarocladium implicatum]
MRQGRGTLEVLDLWSEEEKIDKVPTLLPPDQTSFEFELMIRHPVAFPVLAPLDSHIETATALDQIQSATDPAPESGYNSTSDQEMQSNTVTESMSPGDYESRLRQVHFARWTTVPVSGAEAASAITNYLSNDHVLLRLFDAEIFLKDLVSGEEEFCSSLLVNSLLGWSLPSIATPDTDYQEQTGIAIETAMSQLKTRRSSSSSLSTLAATQLLSLAALYRGQGATSRRLLEQSIVMGTEMELFADTIDPGASRSITPSDAKADTARSTASWGLFTMATIHSLNCQKNELKPSTTPAYAVPYDGLEGLLPLGAVIARESCKLWKLLHEINGHNYDDDTQISHEELVPFARNMLRRLLQWADELPVSLARGNRSTQEIMIMHIYFHAAIMSLLHPLALQGDRSPLLDGVSQDRSAEAIRASSAAQMHRLVDIHHFRTRTSKTSVFWHTSLLFSANASIRQRGNGLAIRRRRFYRAIDGFAYLHPRYPVMQDIIRGLMAMAVEAGLLGSPEAVRLARELADKGGGGDVVKEPTEACYILDLETALIDRSQALVDKLAQRFAEIVMFDEFTHA